MITDHCCDMIVKCKTMVIENIRKERLTQGVDTESINEETHILGKTLSFGQIGKACLGKKGVLAVNISVMVTQFGFTIGYFIFMGNTLRAILKYFIVPKEEAFHNMTTPFVSMNITTTPFVPTNLSTTTTTASTTSMTTLNSTIHANFSNPFVDFGAVNSSTVLSFLHHHIDHIRLSMSNPWSASNLISNSSFTFSVLILFPLPFLIGIAFVRNLRKLGPISVIANASITGAGIATAIYMLASKSFKSIFIISLKFKG